MSHRTTAATLGAMTLAVIGLLSAELLLSGTAAAQVIPTSAPATGIAVTGGPTATSAVSAGNVLPNGTLILLQRKQPIALLPNGTPLSLKPEQYGVQASSGGNLGVRFDTINSAGSTATTLTLVDNHSGQTTAVPQGVGLSSPSVTWRKSGAGFAFFDFPPTGKTSPTNGAILYYDVKANTTTILIQSPGVGQIAASIAWSPDDRYLVYLVSAATAEGIGGPNAKAYLFDSTTKTSAPLPADAASFLFWDRASQGFFTERNNMTANTSQIVYYILTALANPTVLTPANTLDLLADPSPDGKRLVVSSSPGGKSAPVFNLYVVSLSGNSRKAITAFKGSDQTITAVVWGVDGIYYSLSDVKGDTTWRVDLDGQNPRQVATGTLLDIVGSH